MTEITIDQVEYDEMQAALNAIEDMELHPAGTRDRIAALESALSETVTALEQIKSNPITDDALDEAFGLGALLIDLACVRGKLALEGKDMPTFNELFKAKAG